jgi:hypothetical protein
MTCPRYMRHNAANMERICFQMLCSVIQLLLNTRINRTVRSFFFRSVFFVSSCFYSFASPFSSSSFFFSFSFFFICLPRITSIPVELQNHRLNILTSKLSRRSRLILSSRSWHRTVLQVSTKLLGAIYSCTTLVPTYRFTRWYNLSRSHYGSFTWFF